MTEKEKPKKNHEQLDVSELERALISLRQEIDTDFVPSTERELINLGLKTQDVQELVNAAREYQAIVENEKHYLWITGAFLFVLAILIASSIMVDNASFAPDRIKTIKDSAYLMLFVCVGLIVSLIKSMGNTSDIIEKMNHILGQDRNYYPAGLNLPNHYVLATQSQKFVDTLLKVFPEAEVPSIVNDEGISQRVELAGNMLAMAKHRLTLDSDEANPLSSIDLDYSDQAMNEGLTD